MPELLESDKLKIKILKNLSDNKLHTLYALKKKTGSSYDTLKPNCNFLEKIGVIEVTIIPKEKTANNKEYKHISITSKGIKLIEKLADYKKD